MEGDRRDLLKKMGPRRCGELWLRKADCRPMDRLEENLKRIMQVASVIGREFAFRILQAISDLREDLKSELLNLQGLELIYEKSLFPELEYVFKHALTQEVAYNSLLSNRRKEIHKRIGKAIEELYSENLEEF
jgi:predicted ATPase